MDKQLFERFFELCYINGLNKSIIVDTENKKTIVNSISADKMLVSKVTMKDSKGLFTEGKFAIFDTDIVVKLLSIFSNTDFKVEYNKMNEASNKMILSSDGGNLKAEIMLSDLDIIPKVPRMKQIDDWELNFSMSAEEVDMFIKARNAIPDSKVLFIDNKNMIIGDSEFDSNKVILKLNNVTSSKNVKLKFSADYFKSLVSVIKDKVIISLVADGLMKLCFKNDTFDNTYYLVALSNEE